MGTIVSPFEGRVTAQWRGYKNHAGMDIAPPKPGQLGLPVYAAYAGTVQKAIRWAKRGNRKSTWAPGRTGNGLLIRNPDGEAQGYNHVTPVKGLKVGDRVEAGQLIGHNDSSGNQTGPHLHFEMWADYRRSNSDYDPRLGFRKSGVAAGSKPKHPSTGATATASAYARKAGLTVGQTKRLQAFLNATYPAYSKLVEDGDYGARTAAVVKEYQRRAGLYQDGIAGPKTQASLGVRK